MKTKKFSLNDLNEDQEKIINFLDAEAERKYNLAMGISLIALIEILIGGSILIASAYQGISIF